jgi:hypothetical protein
VATGFDEGTNKKYEDTKSQSSSTNGASIFGKRSVSDSRVMPAQQSQSEA